MNQKNLLQISNKDEPILRSPTPSSNIPSALQATNDERSSSAIATSELNDNTASEFAVNQGAISRAANLPPFSAVRVLPDTNYNNVTPETLVSNINHIYKEMVT